MITGKIYANGYWEGMDAVLLRNDDNNAGWIYVLAVGIPDPDMSMNHAISGTAMYCHARIVTDKPTLEEIKNIQAFVYVSNS